MSLGAVPVHSASHRVRVRWYVWLPLAAIWTLAGVRVFVDPTPRVPLVFNWTTSLPYHVGWLTAAPTEPLRRGDLIVYRFEGPAIAQYPGLARQPFFKIVRGLPGDRITVIDRKVRVNGEPVGEPKHFTFDGWPLSPIEPGVIPQGHLFAQGLSPDSFDSRYGASGLVRFDQVIGRVVPIL